MSFDFERETRRFWYDDNAILTVFMAALSSTFPPGEREFVRSVMHYKDQLDPELMERVRAFAGQEGMHARQHTHANEWLDSLGFDAAGCSEHLASEIDSFRKGARDDVLLAITVCAEHITAVLAHYLLTHPEVSERLPEAVRELILWHAVEEIEHKAVAFDVYERVSGNRTLLRQVFVIQTVTFTSTVIRYMRHMLRAVDRKPTVEDWTGAAKFFLGKRGLFPSIAEHYLEFLRGDFHPWDVDDRALIDAWKASRETSAGGASAA